MSWLGMDLVREQYRNLPILITPEKCKNGTFIVTGANVGLGFETAKHLVSLGSRRVIIAVRNTDSGEAALRDIETSTKIKGVAQVWQLDLGNYDSVRAFAKRANQSLDRLDALVENASIALDRWSVSEGHETGMTVNVYSTILLGVLLLPKLKETARKFSISPHLVIVSSSLAFSYKPQVEGLRKYGLKRLDQSENAEMAARYAVTKMIQIFAVRQLATQYPESKTGVIINYLSPGLVKTSLTRHLGLVMKASIGLFRLLLARTAEMGSRTLLHAIGAGKETHGSFLDNCKVMDESLPPWITNEAGRRLQENLWSEISEELERVEPGCFAKLL